MTASHATTPVPVATAQSSEKWGKIEFVPLYRPVMALVPDNDAAQRLLSRLVFWWELDKGGHVKLRFQGGGGNNS